MKARITWNYYSPELEAEYIPSINEMTANTWAQVRKWVEQQIETRNVEELDYIDIDEIGNFKDSEGIPIEFKPIAIYEHGTRNWEWLED